MLSVAQQRSGTLPGYQHVRSCTVISIAKRRFSIALSADKARLSGLRTYRADRIRLHSTCRAKAAKAETAESRNARAELHDYKVALEERLASNAEATSSGHGRRWNPAAGHEAVPEVAVAVPIAPERTTTRTRDMEILFLGVAVALAAQYAVQWIGHTPWWQRISRRFIWWRPDAPPHSPYGSYAGEPDHETTAMVLYSDSEEAVEWLNMCWRKMWRVYQRGLERWIADLLQPVFDNLVTDGMVPRFVMRLRILEFTIDHEAPYFSRMRRRTSRRDSDLNGVVDVRYTGGARMLLLIEAGQGRWRFKLPVLVSDLDLECKMWIKLRLAPMCPYIGSLSLAFVGPPIIKVQLLPYNRVRIMRIPILQAFLTKLLTVDLPGLIVLPKRLDINIPPAVTAVAEAAVGRDAVMRAVASAVLQADALEHALMAALPLGPQSAAGGVSLPDSFAGELQVTLLEARNLPVWGFPWQSNPYCRIEVGSQSFRSRKEDATSHAGSHRAPVWNQEFQFLVEDPSNQVLTIRICDAHITGRPDVGYVKFPLTRMPADGCLTAWLPVQSSLPSQRNQGELQLQLNYKPYEDDEEVHDAYSDRESFAVAQQEAAITDVKSAADASSRAAVAASAAAAAVAVTKAAAARAAAKVRRRAGRGGENGADVSSSNGAPQQWLDGNGAQPPQKRSSTSCSSAEANRSRLAGGLKALAWNSRVLESSPWATSPGDMGSGAAGARPKGVWEIMDSLRDISPDDLFPGVAYSISEDDGDEDMPYTRPVRPTQKRKDVPDSGNESTERRRSEDSDPQGISRRIVDRVPSIGRGQILTSEDAPARIDAGIELDLGLGSSGSPEKKRAWPEEPDSVHNKAGVHRSQPGDGSSAPGGARRLSSKSFAVNSFDDEDINGASAEESSLSSSSTSQNRESVPEEAEHDGRETVRDVAEATERSLRQSHADSNGNSSNRAVDADRSAAELQDRRGERARESENGECEVESDEGWIGWAKGWLPWNRSEQADKHDDSASKPAENLKQDQGGKQEKVSSKKKHGWWSNLPFWGDEDSAEAAGAEAKRKAKQKAEEEEELYVPPDLPIEMIAEEVKESWRLKEVHVEKLMQKAVEQSERPWLILLASMSALSAVLLALVLWRLRGFV